MTDRDQGTAMEAAVTLGCRSCQAPTRVQGPSTRFDCQSCQRQNFMLRCSRCAGANVVLGAGRGEPLGWRCDWCLTDNVNSGMKRMRRQTATADDAVAALDHHGVTFYDPNIRVLGGFELIGGYGDIPPPRTLCSICALAEGVLVVAEAGATGRVSIPYASLLGVETGGQGILRRNAGLSGGGFGLRGAVTGIAVSKVINNMTTKTSVDSFLRLTTAESEMLFSHWKLPPAAIRNALGRIFGAHLAATRAPAPPVIVEVPTATPPAPASLTPIEELQMLTKLHAAGTLTDTEFEVARARQILRLHSAED